MDTNKLNEIVSIISSTYKKATNKKEPDWGKLYSKSVEHAEEIEVHACGDFPEKLIGKSFPNESSEETKYRKDSFQPTTKPYWKKALKKLNRIWAEQNYTIIYGENKEVKEYFTSKTPIYGNVIDFFKSIVTQTKINDPNSVLCIDFSLPVKQNSEGELIIDDGKELEPYPTIYDSDDVLMFESGDFALLLSDEKSYVSYGNGKEKIGIVLYLYDRNTIYRIEQTGKKVDYTFAAKEYYTHNLGYLPVWKLEGTPEEIINGEIYYESHFASAIPHLNEAVIIHSTNKGVRNKVSYPTRVYYEQICKAEGCNNGKIFNADNTVSNCSSCNGTGSVRFSPFTDYIQELPTATNNATVNEVPFPAFTYVSPDGSIIKDNEDVIDKYLSIAFSFINFEGTPDGAKAGLGENATATKTKIDREEQFISILDISNQLFSLLKKYLDAAYKIRYNGESEIKISPPKNFELTTSGEMTAELTEAKKGGIPSIAVSEMVVEYVSKKFPQNADVVRISEIAQYSDSLFTMDSSDIQIYQTANNIEKWQVILHVNFDTFMYEIMDEKPDWKTLNNKDLKAILIEKAKSKESELNSGKQTASNLIKDISVGGVVV